MIDKNDPKLTAYVLGELSTSENAEIEAAIHKSPELSAAVEEIYDASEMLGDAYESEEKLSLFGGQSETAQGNATLQKIEPGTPQHTMSNSDEGSRWMTLFLAVCLGVFLLGGWTTYQKQQREAAAKNLVAVNDAGQAAMDDANSDSMESEADSEVVYKIESRSRQVSVQRMRPETKSRTIQVARTRTETKEVTLEDGTKGSKVVEVPYTENVTQNYTVQYPFMEEVTRTYQFKVPYDANGDRIAEADYEKFGIDPDQLLVRPEIVYRSETKTRTAPITKTRTETRTRQVPVTRNRKEKREVTLADGKKVIKEIDVPYTENVTQSYTVSVPYTENTTQNYQVEVPYTADGKRIDELDYEAYGITLKKPDVPSRSEVVVSDSDVAVVGGAVMSGGFDEDSDGVSDAIISRSMSATMFGPRTPEAIAMRLREAQSDAELIKERVGSGHPDYEAAIAQVRAIKLQQVEREKNDLIEQIDELLGTKVQPDAKSKKSKGKKSKE